MINNSIKNTIIGIDLAKNSMHLVQVDQNGKKIGYQKVTRDELIAYLIPNHYLINKILSNSKHI